MLTQHTTSRLWVAGLVCLLATSASAQERTASSSTQNPANRSKVQQTSYWHGTSHTPIHYPNAWAGYAPGTNTYPSAANDPNRGYTAYGYSGGSHCWCNKWGCNGCGHDCAAKRAECGHRFRCSMAWLKPLTYWDAGCQTDIIALNPGYAHPNDLHQGYAAQGYGGPVSIPQAPNVRANFNYGWGIPSSRLTPTSIPYGY